MQNLGLIPLSDHYRTIAGALYLEAIDHAGTFSKLIIRGTGDSRRIDFAEEVTP